MTTRPPWSGSIDPMTTSGAGSTAPGPALSGCAHRLACFASFRPRRTSCVACLRARADTGINAPRLPSQRGVNHLMFAGRRGRVYDRIVVLSGVQPGTRCWTSDRAAGISPAGWPPPRARRAGSPEWTRRNRPSPTRGGTHAPGMTFTVGVAQDLGLPGRVVRHRHLHAGDAPYSCPPAPGCLRRDVPGNQTRRPPADRGPGTAAAPARAAAAAHHRGRPLQDLAAAAGYQVNSAASCRCSATSWPSARGRIPGARPQRCPRRPVEAQAAARLAGRPARVKWPPD